MDVLTRKEFDRVVIEAGMTSSEDRDWSWRNYEGKYLDNKSALSEKQLQTFVPGLISLMKHRRRD